MEDVAVIRIDATAPAASAASPAGAAPACGQRGAVATCSAAPAGVRLSFFAIADGHGGANVVRFAAENLHEAVMKAGLAEELQRLSEAAAAAAAAGDEAGSAQAAACPQPSLKQCRAGITEGFKELDRRILERCAAEGWPDGCTAVAVWVLGDTALVANVGDARCVLARRPAPPPGGSGAGAQAAAAVDGGGGAAAEASGGSEGAAGTAEAAVEGGQDAQRSQAGEQGQAAAQQAQQAQQEKAPQQAAQQTAQQAAQHAQQQLEALKAVTLTREHKPVFPAERQRIERAGSFVSADGRLAGRIEVSRAFGDRQFKRSGLSALPDVQAFQLGPREAFLLLACDGFWGVFSPQDAVDFAQREMAEKGRDPKQTCNRLLHEAIRERRCKDNCTVMLVKFG